MVLARAVEQSSVRLLVQVPSATVQSRRINAIRIPVCTTGRPQGLGCSPRRRTWSGAMVLEHLATVGTHVITLTAALCAGRPSSWVLRTRDVKPTGALTRQETAAVFEAMVRAYVELLRSEGNAIRSSMRHQHPWFGALRIKQWLAFMTLHHMVHVPHIKAIAAAVGITDTS